MNEQNHELTVEDEWGFFVELDNIFIYNTKYNRKYIQILPKIEEKQEQEDEIEEEIEELYKKVKIEKVKIEEQYELYKKVKIEKNKINKKPFFKKNMFYYLGITIFIVYLLLIF